MVGYKGYRKLSHSMRFAYFLFVIVYWYTCNSTVVEISHETLRLACFAYPHNCKKASFSRTTAHILVSPGDTPGAITLNVVWMEREFDAYKLSRCMCPSNYNRCWDTARYLWKNRQFFHTIFYSRPRYGGFPSEYWHPLWYGKTRMVSLPDVENFRRYLCSFWRNYGTWRTDTGWQHITRLCICIAR